ncbi:hypothetical protein AGF18_24420 [Klebsiella oxytoca]|nr:hypothetical protein AGF18_24420 [Klebsiella oxytoca]
MLEKSDLMVGKIIKSIRKYSLKYLNIYLKRYITKVAGLCQYIQGVVLKRLLNNLKELMGFLYFIGLRVQNLN